MAVENIPLWTLLHNWRETVSERLTWNSPVLRSLSGAEQAFATRRTPKRAFDIAVQAVGDERSWLDNALSVGNAARWYVPLPHDVARTTAVASETDDTIPVVTAGHEFRVGGYVMILRDLWTAAVHEITAVASDSLTVTPDLTMTYDAGTFVAPCAAMRLTEQQQDATRITDTAAEARLRFEVDGASPFTPETLVAAYAGYPVLTTSPNFAEDLTAQYTRLLAEFATPLTRRSVVDTADKGFTVQQHRWMRVGKTEQDALRAYFHALQGRRVPTWVPTFMADFRLVASALSGATAITVARCGFTRFGGPRFNRQHIVIELHDGTRLYREITDATEVGDTEVLDLNAALGVAITPSSVRRISFLALCRLDQDEVSFTHYTDKAGAMTCVVSFRTCGEFRSAPASVTPAFPYPNKGIETCGFGDSTPYYDGGLTASLSSGFGDGSDQPVSWIIRDLTPLDGGTDFSAFRTVFTASTASPPLSSYVPGDFTVRFEDGRISEGVFVRLTHSSNSALDREFGTTNWVETGSGLYVPWNMSIPSGLNNKPSRAFYFTMDSSWNVLLTESGTWTYELWLTGPY